MNNLNNSEQNKRRQSVIALCQKYAHIYTKGEYTMFENNQNNQNQNKNNQNNQQNKNQNQNKNNQNNQQNRNNQNRNED